MLAIYNEEKAVELVKQFQSCMNNGVSRDAAVMACLMEMAEWKDEQHSVAYVVTRSDMHYDEVEKVFFDIEKAEQYCAGYNNDENAYRRNITKINVTL